MALHDGSGARVSFLRRFEKRRRDIRIIAQILLYGLVAHHDSESPAGIDVDGFLYIQFFEADHLLDGFRATFIEHGEMDLAIEEPVVVHAIDRAVFQKELRERVLIQAIDINTGRVRQGRGEIMFERIAGKEPIVAAELPAPNRTAVNPPRGAKSRAKIEEWGAIDERTPKN